MDASEILEQAAEKYPSIKPEREDDLEYDLGSLAAFDPHSLDVKSLKEDQETTIITAARDAVQLMINKFFDLPTKKIENGVAALLPPPTTRLPREKPAPKPKAMTRWEQFAIDKGIKSKKKSKRGLVFDEMTGEYLPAYGKNRAKKAEDDWVIEAKASDDPNVEDPFLARSTKKKENVRKQRERELANESRSGQTFGSSLPATIALVHNDPKKIKASEKKQKLSAAFSAAQVSTISMGKFDKKIDGEKAVKKKRKFEPVETGADFEKSKSLKILDRMANKSSKIDVNKAANQAITSQMRKRSMTERKDQKWKRKR